MVYAPIVIPTLSRFEHLKRLIDSLEKNTWIENTELIISLDFPPNEKYVDGYKKTRDYLNKLKEYNRFKKVTIIEQKTNLGPITNALWLIDYLIKNNYDRWIFTEDDNVFSQNFIMYMDKGLELFEKDDSVQAICGCHDLGDFEFDGNVIKQLWYHPHGQATWKDKYIQMKNNFFDILMNEHSYSLNSIFPLFLRSKYLFQYYICNILCDRTSWIWKNEKEIFLIDNTETLYNYFIDGCCIVPEKYKSHSCGFDGSGVGDHVRNIDPNKVYPLDIEKEFEYDIPSPFKVDSKTYKALDKSFNVGFMYLIFVWFQYVVFRISGNNWRVVHRIVCSIRKLIKKDNFTLSNYT
jgi:hypothetical protein